MEGSCERSPKWQNLKFAEISVWRRVSGLFLPFYLGYFGLLFPVSLPRGHKYTESCTHSFGCLLIFMQLKAMRNFSIAPPHLPTLPLAAAEKDVIEYHSNLHSVRVV